MAITYESICDKLGFKPEEYEYSFSGYEDDSKASPLAVLSEEELDFLIKYLISVKK